MENSPLERPPANNSLESELNLTKCDVKERSCVEKKKKKRKWHEKRHNASEDNDINNDPQEGNFLKKSSSLEEKEERSCVEKKSKRQKKRHNASEDNDINNDLQEGILLKTNSSLEGDLVQQPPVNISCKMDAIVEDRSCAEKKKKKKRKKQKKRHNASEDNDINKDLMNASLEGDPVQRHPVSKCYEKDAIAGCNSEVSLFQGKDKEKKNNQRHKTQSNAGTSLSSEKIKGKEHNKRCSALEDNDIDHDIPETVETASPDLTINKHIQKEDLNSVLDVAELESTRIKKNYEVPKSSDACSIKKHGNHAEVDDSSETIKTYRRRERVKIYQKKRRKDSDSLGNSLEPIKEDGTNSSLPAVQSSLTGETLSDCSSEGIIVQVAEDISMEEASVNCSDGKPAKQAVNGEQDKIQIAVQDGIRVEEILDESPMCYEEKVSNNPSGCDPSHKHLEQKDVEIETKMEEIIPSTLHLGAIKDDDDDIVVINNEGNSPRISHSSPDRAHLGHFKKKLLILDVNGLLVDIVPYFPDGYKPDITIAKKAVFKRPFCEEFLQFCFEKFSVGVWTSRTKRNVDRVLDFLMGDSKRNLLFCWDQFHCTETGFNTIENRDKPLLLKELKRLWEKHEPDLPWEKGEYNESNTLLLDDSPYKALRNPVHTAIFPHSYRYKDIKDCSLGPKGDLRVYLEGLAEAENVQRYVEQYPFGQRPITESNLSWGFYRRIIGIESDQPKDDASNSSTCW